MRGESWSPISGRGMTFKKEKKNVLQLIFTTKCISKEGDYVEKKCSVK